MPSPRDGGPQESTHAPSPVSRAAEILLRAPSIVVLTGAGVSAESGVPTFRDAQTGLWAKYDPETLASPRGFAADPGLVWRWYMARFGGVERSRPNPGHFALASLEAWVEGRGGDAAGAARGVPARESPGRFVLYTQNVDNLHEKAGSREVRHLHGSIARYRCDACRRPHPLSEEQRDAPTPPVCAHCGALVRPDVVWFGEMLPEGVLQQAWKDARESAVMLVVGTSGLVHPAAQIPIMAHNARATVIDVNPEPTPISGIADLFLQGPSGEVLPRVLAAMGLAPPDGSAPAA